MIRGPLRDPHDPTEGRRGPPRTGGPRKGSGRRRRRVRGTPPSIRESCRTVSCRCADGTVRVGPTSSPRYTVPRERATDRKKGARTGLLLRVGVVMSVEVLPFNYRPKTDVGPDALEGGTRESEFPFRVPTRTSDPFPSLPSQGGPTSSGAIGVQRDSPAERGTSPRTSGSVLLYGFRPGSVVRGREHVYTLEEQGGFRPFSSRTGGRGLNHHPSHHDWSHDTLWSGGRKRTKYRV